MLPLFKIILKIIVIAIQELSNDTLIAKHVWKITELKLVTISNVLFVCACVG